MTTPIVPTKHRDDHTNQPEPTEVPCFQCGICCTKYQIRLTCVEACRIADGLGLSWDSFLDACVDQSASWDNSYLLKRPKGACIFLRPASVPTDRDFQGQVTRFICSVHAFKPLSCLYLNASLLKKDCRDGLCSQWGLSTSEDGQPAGTNDRLHRFREFLKSIQ